VALDRLFYICAGVAGFIGVAFGAVATHAFKGRLTPETLAVFETGVRYQMYHTLALFAAAWGWTRWQHRAIAAAGILFVIGIVLFSGSIYLRVLANAEWAAAFAPMGGTSYLTGWLCLAVGAWRGSNAPGK